jgi:Glycosyl hydrolase catalytic core/Secretion system C-terminal sorting domain/F5/8 type C domain
MKRILQLGTIFIMCIGFFANAQDIVWTGSASNNDFFDEGNWKNSLTNIPPSSGAINPGVAVNLPLRIDNVPTTIIATGEINVGSGSLTIGMANLTAQSFSGAGGTFTINEGAYVELSDTAPFKFTTPQVQINFTSGLAWIRTVNVSARLVSVSYLALIKVNGANSVYRTNLRLDNYYFTGCVIRTNLASTAPLTVYDGTNLQGSSVGIPVSAIHSGAAIPGAMNEKIESFLLKKGFMVTIADEADGTGKSKNYIASEADLVINVLPATLQNAVSFIRVMPWNWTTKKGFNSTIDSNLNASWRYQWNSFENSPTQNEYVPMSWGQGTADDVGVAKFIALYNTTHLLSFNEPDDCNGQSGQYGNPKLCVIDEAVKWHKNLMKTGMRMISPGGREEAPFGWLKDFHKKATEQDVRIDVIAVHWYDWGSNPTVNTNPTPLQVFNRFKAYLTNVHNLYGLPIWITEFNANPARSQAINAGFLELALPYLESLDYIERYCWFPFNTGTHFTGWNEATNSPSDTTPSLVGTIYKNINNTTPVASSPSIPEATVDQNNNLNLVQFPNVALNKMATANSSSSSTFVASKAVDGDTASSSSMWVVNFGNPGGANYTPLPAWIEVDLQGSFTIDSFRIIESSSALKDFNFQVWDATLNAGAGGWTTALTVTGNPASPLTTYKTINPVTTSKVRLFITAHNSTTALRMFELEVYGKPAATLGVPQFEAQKFSIYPNPVTNNILNISGEQEVQSVAIFNIVGAKMAIPFENNQLNVDSLAPGIYFLKINNKYSYKFIKK